MRASLRSTTLPFMAWIGLTLITLSGCARTPKQKEAKFLENGKRQMLRKDYARAALEFRNAVGLMPNDAEAHYQLGLAELDGGQLIAAVSEFRKATELNPGHAGAQVKLAEIMALSGLKDFVQEGEQRARDVLRSSPDDVDAVNALALSEVQLGKWQDAQAHLEQVLAKFPQSVSSAVALAKLDLVRRDLKGAEQVLKKAVQDAPRSPEASTGLGQLYLLTGRWSEAQGQFQSALKIAPNFPLALIGFASAQIRLGRTDQAEQTYRTISALPDKEYRYMYAAYLFHEGKHELAVAEFEKLAKHDAGDRDARTHLVAAYLVTDRIQDAKRVLDTALKADAKDVDALLQRSQLLLRSGKQKEAENDLNQVLHYQPESAPGHFLLASVCRDRGDSLRERLELGEAIRLNASFLQARLELARSLVNANSAKAALSVLDAAPEPQKGILALVVQRNWALLALGNQVEARKWVEQGLKVARVPDLLVQESVLKLKGQDYAGARADAIDALKQNPDDVRALRVVAASYVAQKMPAAASHALEEHVAQHPKAAAAQQFLGDWLFAQGDPVGARAAFAAAKAVNPNSVPVNLGIAQVDVLEGKLDEARTTLGTVISENSTNPEPYLWLGSIEVKVGDYRAAMEHFRKVLELDDKSVPALNNLAYLLANFADQPEEALALAQRARELAPDNVDTEGTLGWVLYRRGVYNAALKYLLEAVAKDGDGSTHNAALRKYHLGMTYLKLGDKERGQKALNAALKINPNLPKTEMAN